MWSIIWRQQTQETSSFRLFNVKHEKWLKTDNNLKVKEVSGQSRVKKNQENWEKSRFAIIYGVI